MTHDQDTEPVVISRTLMSPRRIRLNAVGVLLVATLMFWISTTLPVPFSKYSWVGYVGFAGATIMSLWGFVIAQRREWWINEQNKVEVEESA